MLTYRMRLKSDFSAPVPEANIVKIGNAAVAGATAVLLSDKKRADIEAFVNNIEHIELETTRISLTYSWKAVNLTRCP